MEKNCRRPLDRSDERTSLDTDPDRRHSLVPRLQKPRKAEQDARQEEENQCLCPRRRTKEEIQNQSKEGRWRAPGCYTPARLWGGKRDADRLLPAGCELKSSIQNMGRCRSALQMHCWSFHRFVCLPFYYTMIGNKAVIDIHVVSSQVCECCDRTPPNACFHSFAPLTTTSLVSRAW